MNLMIKSIYRTEYFIKIIASSILLILISIFMFYKSQYINNLEFNFLVFGSIFFILSFIGYIFFILFFGYKTIIIKDLEIEFKYLLKSKKEKIYIKDILKVSSVMNKNRHGYDTFQIFKIHLNNNKIITISESEYTNYKLIKSTIINKLKNKT